MTDWDFSKVDQPTIYVDVDNTVMFWRRGEKQPQPNERLLSYLAAAKKAGASIYLWSRAGADHARRAATHCAAEELFAGFLPKPQEFFDDDYGWLDAAEKKGPAQQLT